MIMELGCFEYLIYCTMNYLKFINTYVCKRERGHYRECRTSLIWKV